MGRKERLRAVLTWIADFMNRREIPLTGYVDKRITLGGFPDYSPRLFTRYYRGLDVRKEIRNSSDKVERSSTVTQRGSFMTLSV